MARLLHHRRLRRFHVAIVVAALAGLASAAMVGLAVAKTLTLQVAKGASVTNFNTHATTKEAVVTNSKGRVVYTLSGDTTAHPKCTKANGCFGEGGRSGTQYATMLSLVSSGTGICTSSIFPEPQEPFGSIQAEGRRSYRASRSS